MMKVKHINILAVAQTVFLHNLRYQGQKNNHNSLEIIGFEKKQSCI